MKDATGELSMTAVAVVAIAAMALVFSNFIWPVIRENIKRSTYCAQSFGCTNNCASDNGSCTETCYYCKTENDTESCDYTVKCSPNNTSK